MNAGFEGVIWDDVEISMHTGSVILARGLYMVTVLHDERGRTDGAQLSRIDADGEKPIRLSQGHFEMLDGTPYFERR
jgi:hypothetical protein